MPTPTRTISVTAHRGNASFAPENTMAAFEQAIQCGADTLETDIRLTLDGIPVLFHDADLERLSASPARVDQLTLAELQSFDVGSWHSPEYAAERVPTLASLAKRCRRDRIRLLLDLKVDGAESAIAAALATAELPQDQTSICAWTPPQAAGARVHLPDAPLLHIERPVRPGGHAWLDDLTEQDFAGVSLRHQEISPAFVAAAHELGLRVYTWTVNTQDEFEEAIARQVDGIITDDPAALTRRLKTQPPL